MSTELNITLDQLVFVGSGHKRNVYVHPDDNNKCIKIMRREHLGTHYEKLYKFESKREHDYYKFLAGRDVSYSHISKYHGKIQIRHETRTLHGNTFDLIRNDNQEVSSTLDVELIHEGLDINGMAASLHQLYLYLLRNKVISGFKMKNIVVQHTKKEPPKCILIDNIGNTDYIPIYNYVDYLASIKIKRRWRKFLKSMLQKHQGNSVATQVFQEVYDNAR